VLLSFSSVPRLLARHWVALACLDLSERSILSATDPLLTSQNWVFCAQRKACALVQDAQRDGVGSAR
jgi:hypothetical protein